MTTQNKYIKIEMEGIYKKHNSHPPKPKPKKNN